jgi:hypothetical protein
MDQINRHPKPMNRDGERPDFLREREDALQEVIWRIIVSLLVEEGYPQKTVDRAIAEMRRGPDRMPADR